MKTFAPVLAAVLVAAFALAQDDGSTVQAEVVVAQDLDQVLGTVTFEEAEEGGVVARFDIAANDVIEPGEHAIHIHENPDCAPADTDGDGNEEPAGAAGGHFDPTDVGHGEDDGPHVGDSAEYNYAFGDDGSFTGEVLFPQAGLEGENGILANGGTSILIHAGVDDMESNPSGESGPRVACGVITASDGG